MELEEDAIVEISERQISYFGGPGKMVLPSVATVEGVIKRVPESKVITTDLLRKELAEQFEVQGACPVTTKKALRAIANDPGRDVAYWRVIKQNGELMAYFPGGVEGHAVKLEAEGFAFDRKGKVPKVKQFKESLVNLD